MPFSVKGSSAQFCFSDFIDGGSDIFEETTHTPGLGLNVRPLSLAETNDLNSFNPRGRHFNHSTECKMHFCAFKEVHMLLQCLAGEKDKPTELKFKKQNIQIKAHIL